MIRPWTKDTLLFETKLIAGPYLLDIADCDEPVLIQDAVETVDRMLPEATVPRFSKSLVLRCFFNLRPCKQR